SNVDILEPDSLAYGKTCECGRDLTLSCKFKNKTFAIAWMNQNDISAIAQCIRNKCDINPKYIDQYKISYDETNHIFNLTIIKLTMKDNGRKLVCSDGTNTDSQLIRVKDYEPLLFENTTAGTIQAISGCISNVTRVSFKWIKICGRNKREKEITPKIHNTTTSCSNNSDCGNDQQIQYSEVISAKASNNGNCYLKVVADYGNEKIESYHTVGKYMMEDQDEERSNTVIVVAVIVLGSAFLLIFALARCFIYLRHQKKKEDEIQSLGYDGTEDHEEGVISEANDMTSNETKENDNSHCQTVPKIEEENGLSSEEQTSIDLNPDRDVVKKDGKQTNLLAKLVDILKNDEEHDLSAIESTANDNFLGQDVPEIGEENNLSSKEQTRLDLNTDGGDLRHDEKHKIPACIIT
ncbi:uncharacterized protein LOC132756250, partial [Ruditapes philippinarum]|uniref:uncharacterized protein LOC132756250 n=1 Tax=Ruditapes philippinarum TaxID=129788 RepID=UPI00295B5EF3